MGAQPKIVMQVTISGKRGLRALLPEALPMSTIA